MRRAGRVVAEMHERIREAIRPGVTTARLDSVGRSVLESRGASSNFLGYGSPPFPGVICASPDDVVIHGIPGPRVLEEGSIISVDCGAVLDGWHADAAFTAPVGEVPEEASRLIEVAERALAAGLQALEPGGRLGDYGHAVQSLVEAAGFSIVRDYVGHGIGRAMHEPPDVPNWGKPRTGMRLAPGHVLAVEPMLNQGGAGTRLAEDGWTVLTADGSLSAHVEHTVAVAEEGPLVLTAP